MPYIDYLDPNRAGDLNYQRQQRTAALDRELGYDIAGYGGNQQKIQARGQQYGRDLNYMNQLLQDEGLDPFYDRNAQQFRQTRQAAQGLASQRAAANQPFSPTSDAGGGYSAPGLGSYMKPDQVSAILSRQNSAPPQQSPPQRQKARYSDFLNGSPQQPRPTADYSTAGTSEGPYAQQAKSRATKYTQDVSNYGRAIADRNWQNAGYNAPGLNYDKPSFGG